MANEYVVGAEMKKPLRPSQDLADIEEANIKKALRSRFLVLDKISTIIRTMIDKEVDELNAQIQTKLDIYDKIIQQIPVMQEDLRQLKQKVQAGAPPAARPAAGTTTYKLQPTEVHLYQKS